MEDAFLGNIVNIQRGVYVTLPPTASVARRPPLIVGVHVVATAPQDLAVGREVTMHRSVYFLSSFMKKISSVEAHIVPYEKKNDGFWLPR